MAEATYCRFKAYKQWDFEVPRAVSMNGDATEDANERTQSYKM